jgi:hypothetical protein
MQPSRAVLAALLLASCASSVETGEPRAGERVPEQRSPAGELSARFPAARTALRIEDREGTGVALSELLSQLSASTGLVYAFDHHTSGRLETSRVQISAPVTVEPRHAYPWVEALLLQHGFEVSAAPDTVPPLATVRAADGPNRANLPMLAVSPEHRAFLREHPALLVNTTVSLPHLDVRTLGNSMRALSGGIPSANILAVANTNSVVVAGTASYVADMVELLERVDELAEADIGLDTQAALEKAQAEAEARPAR